MNPRENEAALPAPMDYTMVGLESKKILFLGGIYTGKSTIIKQLTSSTFDPEYVSTIEECYNTKFKFEDKILHLQIYDISGFDIYDVMREQMMKAADGIVVVYNITQEDSLAEAYKLGEKAKVIRGEKIVPMVLVGCMLDMEKDRKVPKKDGEELSLKLQCPFREISAKDNDSVVELFTSVLRESYRPRETPKDIQTNKQVCCCRWL